MEDGEISVHITGDLIWDTFPFNDMGKKIEKEQHEVHTYSHKHMHITISTVHKVHARHLSQSLRVSFPKLAIKAYAKTKNKCFLSNVAASGMHVILSCWHISRKWLRSNYPLLDPFGLFHLAYRHFFFLFCEESKQRACAARGSLKPILRPAEMARALYIQPIYIISFPSCITFKSEQISDDETCLKGKMWALSELSTSFPREDRSLRGAQESRQEKESHLIPCARKG